MNFTLKIVKYILIVVAYVVLCSFLIVARINYKTTVDRTFRKNQSAKLPPSDISNFKSFFPFEEKSVVKFDDLAVGNIVTKEVSRRKLERVYEICEKYRLTEKLERKHYLYSDKHETLYCWIRKIASTSFTKLFSNMRGRKVFRNYYREVDFLAPRTMEELKGIINDTKIFKFMVVRHPFHRLVSAYRDRIEDNSRYTAQAWIYAPRIFRLTRPQLFHSNRTSGNGLRNIFNSYKELKTIPSFEEFVLWLLKEPLEKDDDHWNQYHKHCSICNVNFDYILNLDDYTFNEINYIFTKLGLDVDKVDLPNIQSSRGGKSDFARTCDYFRTLSRSLVVRLYERYKIDFQMFDYNYEDYVNCSKNANEGNKIF